MNTNSGVQQKMIRVIASGAGARWRVSGCRLRARRNRREGRQAGLKAVEAAKDKLNPEGPAEKAGKQVDKAIEDAKGK